MIRSCLYTRPSTDPRPSVPRPWARVGGEPSVYTYTRLKIITTCNHCATLFTRPFSSHVCFLEMPDLWEDSEVMRPLEIWRDQEIHKQFEGSTPKKKIFEIISARLALVYTYRLLLYIKVFLCILKFSNQSWVVKCLKQYFPPVYTV